MRPRYVWGGILGTLAAYDYYADRNAIDGDTLSEVTRSIFAVHTPAGRVVFVGSWLTLTAWVLPHILKAARASS